MLYYKMFLMLLISLSFGSAFCQVNNMIKLDPGYKGNISWQTPFNTNGVKTIRGLIKTQSGTPVEIKWVVNEGEFARLTTSEASSGGKLTPQEKRLMMLVLTDGNTLLFQEWLPLLNIKEPLTIRIVASVSTVELFSVLPWAEPPSVSPVVHVSQVIHWEKQYLKNGIYYKPGSLKAPFGTLNILWKKDKKRLPELVTIESPGVGELPQIESKLYLWKDENSSYTIICQEKPPLLNQKYVSYLYPLVKIKTAKLMSRLKQINNI